MPKVAETVTKTDYNDGKRGYYTRIPADKVKGLGYPNYHKQVRTAILHCIKQMDYDGYCLEKVYANILVDGDVSVRVVSLGIKQIIEEDK